MEYTLENVDQTPMRVTAGALLVAMGSFFFAGGLLAMSFTLDAGRIIPTISGLIPVAGGIWIMRSSFRSVRELVERSATHRADPRLLRSRLRLMMGHGSQASICAMLLIYVPVKSGHVGLTLVCAGLFLFSLFGIGFGARAVRTVLRPNAAA